MGSGDVDEFKVAGISFAWMPNWARVLFLVAGVFISYGAASIIQEYVLKSLKFPHSSVMTLAIPLVTMSFGGLMGGFKNRKAPYKAHFAAGFLSCATVGLSNYSLLFLNFPTQIIFKSSKVIPVMIIGTMFYRKKFTLLQYSSALLLIAGLVLFVLGDQAVSPNFNYYGLFIIGLALLADAFVGNTQEHLFSYGATQMETLCYSNMMATLVSLVAVMTSDSILVIIRHLAESPRVCVCMLLIGFVNFLGMNFVLTMIKYVGAAQTVFATSLRKACTLALSFVLFPKPISPQHVAGATLVIAGVALNIYAKRLARPKKLSRSPSPSVSKDLKSVGLEMKGSPLPGATATAEPASASRNRAYGDSSSSTSVV